MCEKKCFIITEIHQFAEINLESTFFCKDLMLQKFQCTQ
jgi:hypothetical protein